MERAATRIWIAMCFAIAFASVPLAVHAVLGRAGVEAPPVALDILPKLEERLAELADPTQARSVAFLGDSTAIATPARNAVPAQLARAASRATGGEPPVRVVSLAFPGLGPVDYYWLADRVADASPDDVVLVFNAASLGPLWARRLSRPELSGWVRASRLPEALTLPLGWIEVRADEILLHAGLARAGLGPSWHRARVEQARVGAARRRLEAGWSEASVRYEGERAAFLTERAAALGSDRDGLESRYGAALAGLGPDHPALVILAATVRTFQRRGVRPIVYFAPMNVTALARVGLYDVETVSRTLASLGQVVRDAGGTFVDLHAYLAPQAFRDPQGHYAHGGDVDGAALVARALAPAIAKGIGGEGRGR